MNKHTFKSNFTTNFEFSKAKIAKTHNLTIIYIHGLYSDPWGRKPEAVKQFAEENNLDFIRFELIGHGLDSANYEKADLNLWKAQVLEVIDEITSGDLIMVGSSLGGWLSLLAGIERPERVKGIVGLAAAPDFTIDLENHIFTSEQKTEMAEKGKILFTNNDFTYVFTKKMFDSGRENALLGKKIPLTCPVQLIQGQKDASLDPNKAFNIAKCLESDDVVIKLLKNSNHRLGTDEDMAEINASIKSILQHLN